jgi:hypothetical protein
MGAVENNELNNREVIRVIGCQGSIQFMTAAHALIVHEDRSTPGRVYKNYLLVYDLYAPNGQSEDFFLFIKGMAGQGPVTFEKVCYIDPPTSNSLGSMFHEHGIEEVRKKILEVTGINHVDELYLSTNWQPLNKLLINCFRSSYKVCYGDSIGLHIPEHYFSDHNFKATIKRSGIVQLARRLYEQGTLALKFPRRKPVFGRLHEVKFDVAYYVTVELVEKKPAWKYFLTDKSSLLKTYQRYTPLLSTEEIRDLFVQGGGSPAIMMTTNFSEAGRMTLENELNAYLQFVQRHVGQGTLLIIKPHPRDSKSKLDELRRLLSANAYNVAILDDIKYYFVPFELFLLRIRENYPEFLADIRYFTFSSSCLSIKFLFGQEPYVGMETDLVNKYFNPSQRSSRIKHEQDLRRLLATG